MKNNKELPHKKSDFIQMGQFSPPVIEKCSQQLADVFLKDKVFFDGLERELILSLRNIDKGKLESYNNNTSVFQNSSVNQSLSNDSHLYPKSDVTYNSLNMPILSSNLSEKSLNYNLENKSCAYKFISKNAADIDEVLHPESDINDLDLNSEIIHGLDEDLDEKHKINPINLDEKEKILNDQLKNKSSIDSSITVKKIGEIKSYPPEEKNIFLDCIHDNPLKSEKNVSSSNIQHTEKLQVDDSDLSLKGTSKKNLEPASAIEDNIVLDFEDIEKELLSVSHSDEISNPDLLLDDLVNQKKSSSSIEKDQDLDFDITKIVKFENFPEELDNFIMPFSEEKISIENLNCSLEQDIAALSFEERDNKEFSDDSRVIEQEFSVKKDNVLENEFHQENIFSSLNTSVDDFQCSRPSSSNNIYDNVKKDSTHSRLFWLIGYIFIVVGFGIYWFFQLNREIDFASGGPRIINASKNPLKVFTNDVLDKENNASFDQVHEVYDRFSGKKPSFPKQTELLDSQEKPVDLLTIDKAKTNNESRNILDNATNDIQSILQVSDKNNKDESRLESIIIKDENPQLYKKSSFPLDNKGSYEELDYRQVDNKKTQGNIPLPSSDLW
ncbi:hypothetical protein [Candidatus Liberibacter brunswickensis]|uniref:hypothetical protein n=1 Tax=Candidatus Liberibacter brunswickensis TaxID=1968796 RepID=UPI002FE081B1